MHYKTHIAEITDKYKKHYSINVKFKIWKKLNNIIMPEDRFCIGKTIKQNK